eukprot:scaffold35137_cov70-Attheya_sp.AAC.1
MKDASSSSSSSSSSSGKKRPCSEEEKKQDSVSTCTVQQEPEPKRFKYLTLSEYEDLQHDVKMLDTNEDMETAVGNKTQKNEQDESTHQLQPSPATISSSDANSFSAAAKSLASLKRHNFTTEGVRVQHKRNHNHSTTVPQPTTGTLQPLIVPVVVNHDSIHHGSGSVSPTTLPQQEPFSNYGSLQTREPNAPNRLIL